MIVGYARVSTTDQDYEIQVEQLRGAGAEKVFSEKLSGTKADNRPELQRMLEFVREGDVVLVTRLDRLARSVLDLHAIVDQLARKGVAFRCTEQAGVDTSTTTGKLTLAILAAVAEFETAIRKDRQMEGIAKAKAAGAYAGKGRLPTIDAAEVVRMRREGHGPAAIAKALNISRQSVYRLTTEL